MQTFSYHEANEGDRTTLVNIKLEIKSTWLNAMHHVPIMFSNKCCMLYLCTCFGLPRTPESRVMIDSGASVLKLSGLALPTSK
jgi:hypothetical protein